MLDGLAGEILEMIACCHVAAMIPFVNFSLGGIFIGLFFTRSWYIPTLYLAWWYYDKDTPHLGGRRMPFIRNWSIWRYLARYFPIKLHKTADLDPSKNYLFVFHPHGLVVYGGLANFATNATGFDETFPGITSHVVTANGQFKVPFYRDYLIAAGLSSHYANSITYKLTQMGPGHSVCLVLGGGTEVMLQFNDRYVIKVIGRKGFIRVALKTGACVVPVFSFNEHRVYDVTYAEKGSLVYYFHRVVKFLFQVDMPQNVHGRQWFWHFVPKRVPINTVVGAPIDFNKLKSFEKGSAAVPPDDFVDECHQIYVDALRKLYDDHKARFGDENTPLIFV